MPNPWYLPETAREAVDAVEDIAAITAFLKETCTLNAEDHFTLTKDGQFGLFCLLDFMQDCLVKSNEILAREV